MAATRPPYGRNRRATRRRRPSPAPSVRPSLRARGVGAGRNSSVSVPEQLVLGGGNFGGIGSAPELFGHGESEEEAFAIMDAAWASGIRWFDTADAYGGGRSERAIGRWIAA